jgi:hypothetical protein
MSGIHPPTRRSAVQIPMGAETKTSFLLQKKITNVLFQLRMSTYAKYLEKKDNS